MAGAGCLVWVRVYPAGTGAYAAGIPITRMRASMENDPVLHAKINLETARIPWKNLQYFFAGGSAIQVAADLDLVDVALCIAQDEQDRVASWLDGGQLAPVTDDLARRWFDQDVIVWAVVVKPWVLVQER